MSLSKINSLIEQEQYYHHYQPLYNLTNGYRIGFEVLFRSGIFKNPEIPFQIARKVNRLYELETKSIHKAIFSYCTAGYATMEERLFINVFPSTITNPTFPTVMNKILTETQLKSQQIIFEINETEVVPNTFSFKKGLSDLKKQGFLFAIDDVGRGSASLRAIIELEPNYVKMDRYFADNLSISTHKQEMIKSIMDYCKNINIHFILEGIENPSDLEVAKSLGVSYGQGYLLGKPSPL